jgi:DNA polymerase I-like protein with 3'-5' exonuclease and polymerase domains
MKQVYIETAFSTWMKIGNSEISLQMANISLQSWSQAIQEIKTCGICGLQLDTLGADPLLDGIRHIRFVLPGDRIYFADQLNDGRIIMDDLAALIEDNAVKKIFHDANFVLSFIRTSVKRRLKAKNIFDIQLASQLCWAGYYDLAPSKSPKNPWKKRVPDHSLEALAERHLGVLLEGGRPKSEVESLARRIGVLLPLYTIFQDLIEKNSLEKAAELEFETISPVVEMELSGICFDSDCTGALIAEKEMELVRIFLDMQAEAKANGFHSLRQEDRQGRFLCH